jgi:hypothetical protein
MCLSEDALRNETFNRTRLRAALSKNAKKHDKNRKLKTSASNSPVSLGQWETSRRSPNRSVRFPEHSHRHFGELKTSEKPRFAVITDRRDLFRQMNAD